MSVGELITELGPVCRDNQRKGILQQGMLNGIDYVEYRHPNTLIVYFINNIPANAYGLITNQHLIRIEGGKRIVGIQVRDVVKTGDNRLDITTDLWGDYSTYDLCFGWSQVDGKWVHSIPELDKQFSRAPFTFKADCPSDFDCQVEEYCPPETRQEPLIDYMAKDYSSFRQLLLDRITQLNPDWLERNPADLGMALVELFAYTGDRLSYYQDSIANEAYLDTARQRVSAKRHAKLIDYKMHDGRNAWAFLHIQAETYGQIPQATKVLTRIHAALKNQSAPPGEVIDEYLVSNEALETDPVLKKSKVFETTFPLTVYPNNNTIYLHMWGNEECCLPLGTTSAYVYALDPANPNTAIRPTLNKGDYLLIEEVKGPNTSAPADADPHHRQVVQLIDVQVSDDPVFSDQVRNESPLVSDGTTMLPLLFVKWRSEDALSFPVCLSKRQEGENPILNISVARGNMVLVDHGRSVEEEGKIYQSKYLEQPVTLPLQRGPLTMLCGEIRAEVDIFSSERRQLDCSSRDAIPAVSLSLKQSSADSFEPWKPVPDLLDSNEFSTHFVVDIDNQGRAILRFGDGVYGTKPTGDVDYKVQYRIGNGRAGNVGAESLAHIVRPDAAIDWPAINKLRNPLPAQDGADSETIEQVRQYAPAAFHAEQFRAVTEEDYVKALQRMPGVSGAVATFRWSCSWFTVFVGVDPSNPNDLITSSNGRTLLTTEFESKAHDYLTRYKLAGYDLEIHAGEYVPLEIELELCVKPAYFQGDVIEAVYEALDNKIHHDGSMGFFHWDNFTFGQDVRLSRLYAVIEEVEGVEAVVILKFERFGKQANNELDTGILLIGPWEITRLDNDPNYRENGVLKINARGGK